MTKRAIFGAIYVAVIICGILCGSTIFLLFMLLLSTLAINEFMAMVSPKPQDIAQASIAMIQRSLDCIGAAIIIISSWSSSSYLFVIIAYVLYVALRLTIQLWITDQNAIQSLSASFMSQIYIGVPIALMPMLYMISPRLLLLLFILVWVNDTFAYLSGRLLGRHKLWERISPKKTWEGFFGGLIMTVVVAFACFWLWPDAFGFFLTANSTALLGAIVCIAATLGDLIESLFKRTVGVKDSGSLIPGHGGILDRIDSILLVIPVSFAYLYLLLYYAF